MSFLLWLYCWDSCRNTARKEMFCKYKKQTAKATDKKIKTPAVKFTYYSLPVESKCSLAIGKYQVYSFHVVRKQVTTYNLQTPSSFIWGRERQQRAE